jgi:carbonic anhydrase
MLAGIGIVIALAQMHVLMGDKPQSSALQNLVALPGEAASLFHSPTSARTHAAIIGVVTLGLLFVWQKVPKKLQAVPGALVAVLVGTLLANLFFTAAPRVVLPNEPLFQFRIPTFPADLGGFIVAVLSIALVASVESLLCAVATDRLHTGPRANLDKELVAQGAANSVSGLIGGLPVTGVIVRSTANISSGGKTRMSAILHGVWILLFVLLASAQLERIPLSALAGLLVFVGVRLVNVHHMRDLVTHREVIVYAITVLGVAFWNLLAGVGLGIGLAVFLLLKRLAQVNVHVEQGDSRWHVRLEGSLTFLSVPTLTKELSRIPLGVDVDVDLMVDFMDHAAFEALHGWRQGQERMGGHVDIDELHEDWYTRAVSGEPVAKKGSGPGAAGDANRADATV